MTGLLRRDIVAALRGAEVVDAGELAALGSPGQLKSSLIRIPEAQDYGSPFHMIRTQASGTSYPWAESVQSHYRILGIAKRFVVAKVAGPAPIGRKSGEKIYDVTGFIRYLDTGTATYLARLESQDRTDKLDPVYVPYLIDCTASNGPTWAWLAITLVVLGSFAPTLASHRRASAPDSESKTADSTVTADGDTPS